MSRKALFTWIQCGEVVNSIYPLKGIIKLDFPTFLASEIRAFPECLKSGQFSILSFSNDIVSNINLINAIIINYQLSIERSTVGFTVIIFFHSLPLSLHLLTLSQVANCETTRAVSRFTLKHYVGACKK